MSETKKLVHQLIELVDHYRSQTHPENTTQVKTDPNELDSLDLHKYLPQNLCQTIEHIDQECDRINRLNDNMGEEILTLYSQLNTTFETTIAVASRKCTQEALLTLAQKIAQGIKSQFIYYQGDLTSGIALHENQNDPKQNLYCLTPDTDAEASKNYYQQNREALQKLMNQNCQTQIATIGYKGNYDLDHEGRGNVMVVSLPRDNDDLETQGTFFFVRSVEDQLFFAVDMNLAKNLAQIGTKILDNILYAQKLHETYLETINALVKATEAKDAYTSGHSNRVAQFACALGRHIGLDDDEINILEWAGLLHDIGKIGIRDEVLCKPGALTDEEFEHIKLHPVYSYNVLEPIGALKCILGAARHHHEHYDGNGYPDGLAGEDIPFHARIIQVADVWDALTSTRSYRKAMPNEKAKKILREEAGTTMDPKLVKSFLEMIESESTIDQTS